MLRAGKPDLFVIPHHEPGADHENPFLTPRPQRCYIAGKTGNGSKNLDT